MSWSGKKILWHKKYHSKYTIDFGMKEIGILDSVVHSFDSSFAGWNGMDLEKHQKRQRWDKVGTEWICLSHWEVGENGWCHTDGWMRSTTMRHGDVAARHIRTLPPCAIPHPVLTLHFFCPVYFCLPIIKNPQIGQIVAAFHSSVPSITFHHIKTAMMLWPWHSHGC